MFNWLKSLFVSPASTSPNPHPQLEMIRDHLDALPDIHIPEGYAVRTYQPGDEPAWCRIMEGHVGENWTVEKCRDRLTQNERFKPENLFFIIHQGRPVASTCAWTSDKVSPEIGLVHMVAAQPEHRGKGLGHLLNALVLHRLKELGHQKAYLLTDDWRLAAIKSYLSSDFRPLNTHESHPERWDQIFEELGVEQ
ncbi:MAG: GNAT family N-acetyltransferase [Candidatus Latescibacteria bacterium]|nr:GNAT family N-acetyltransferase [Candidatus Latescibacterota bacterium]